MSVDKKNLHPLHKKHATPSVSNFFDPLLKGFDEDFLTHSVFSKEFNPVIDIKECDDQYSIVAELPGVDQEDVTLSVKNNTLYITGIKREDHIKEEEGYYHRESKSGSFTRAIPLPTQIEVNDVKAQYEKGRLEISLPKAEVVKSQSIEIPIQA